ncbi:3-isopropylmalate dehydratase large subunit [Trichinella pseudospiralis]
MERTRYCCEHSSLPLVLNLLFVSAVGSVSVTSTKSNKVCRLGADVPVWMLSAIVKIHVIWLLYKPLSHESYGKASIRMPEERPWAAMMTSQYAASYQVVTIPREDRDLSSTKTYGLSLPTITNCSNLSNTGSELVSSVEGRIQTASISQNCPMSGLLSFNGSPQPLLYTIQPRS